MHLTIVKNIGRKGLSTLIARGLGENREGEKRERRRKNV